MQYSHRSRTASSSSSQSSSLSFFPAFATSHSHSSSGSSSNQPDVPIRLHHWLRKTQEVVAHDIRSYILWDIREHPRNAQAVNQLPLPLSAELLNTYATEPPVAYLNITCEFPKPWSTVVYASTGGAAPAQTRTTSAYPMTPHAPHRRVVGVTVADLLTAIYNHLNTESISTTEFNALQPKQQTRILDAYEKRRKMAQSTLPQMHPMSAPAYVSTFTPSSSRSNATSTRGSATQGVKLVDTFLLHTLFAGLEVDRDNACTVNLSVKRPN